MTIEEQIRQRRMEIQNDVSDNILKGFDIDIEKAEEILKSAGTEDLFEKAHKVGDMHPNGKWIWTEYAPGKFDWRASSSGSAPEKRDDGSITLKITNNGSGVVKLSDSVNAKWQDVKDEDFGGRIIGIKIDGKFGAKAFPYSFDSMKRKKYNLYTFEEAKVKAEKYLNDQRLKLNQQVS